MKASRTEDVLREHSALGDLTDLVNAGCKRDQIIGLLDLAFWTDESWQKLVGMRLPRFKREIAQVRSCADILERLNSSELIYHAAIEIQLPQFVDIHKTPSLSDQLHAYADGLDYLRKYFGPKRNPREQAWKARLVAIVIADTKTPHDREVSSLIAAVLENPKYSEKAHQTWRLGHANLISLMGNIVHSRRNLVRPSHPSSHG